MSNLANSCGGNSEIASLVEERNSELRTAIGDSEVDTNAEWDLGQDALGRDMVTLSFSDFSGKVTAIISPDELKSPAAIRARLSAMEQSSADTKRNALPRTCKQSKRS